MFEQITMPEDSRRRSPWTFAASFSVQSILVAAALVVPLLHVAQLDTRPRDTIFLSRIIKAPEPVNQVAGRESHSNIQTLLRESKVYRVFTAPAKVPDRVAMGPDLPGTPEYFTGSAGNAGVAGGVDLSGLVSSGNGMSLPVPPPEPPKPVKLAPVPQAPLLVGGGVQAARLLFGPKPAYPPLARQARISGSVRLAARISADGHIQDLRVMSGHPMLVQAALDAVRQWIYKPTLLNAKPVEVVTDIMVNFTLNQ